ncbi:hypothetical protein Tco_0191583 [Tanacetum coccineum]
MMTDKFSFALANRPPSYVILIFGDGDLCPAFSALHGLGYTTMLIFQLDRVSQSLKKHGGVLVYQNAAFWDMETVGHPRNISHENVNGYIHQRMVEDLGVPRQAVVTYKLYGRRHDDLPYQRYRSDGIHYVETTRSPEHKEHHMQNKLTTDVLRRIYLDKVLDVTAFNLLIDVTDFNMLLRDASTMVSE